MDSDGGVWEGPERQYLGLGRCSVGGGHGRERERDIKWKRDKRRKHVGWFSKSNK